ncbi:MAG TPA: NAD+ synthase [Aestuariivirgaceae bacterium]|jgi:NAD+ synthase|nr:NAD+ synthase [Aestuariivirgaceae bacterium]
MTDRLAIALGQLNPTVGAVQANLEKARAARDHAASRGADLVLFPELYVSGYPPEDLVLKPSFVRACRDAVEALARETGERGPGILLPTPYPEGGHVYNAVALLEGGIVKTVRFKHDLPNYGVFDEKRVFTAGPVPGPIDFRGVRLGVPICEDIWTEEVCETLAETGAELLLVPNGSPFEAGKQDTRLTIAVARVTETGLPLAYLNQVGGQDELVFDGGSFGLNSDRTLAFQMPAFKEDIAIIRWTRQQGRWRIERGAVAPQPGGEEEVWQAIVLGTRDYVRKNGFPGVVLGLSGGIDSAVVAAIAVDALGPELVRCVMMPYRYTAAISLEDAEACAKALGCRYDIVPIAEAVEGLERALQPLFKGLKADVTEENLQSRVRGTILMAISNKLGSMVLTTGNKSEMSVGYATLYGDMNGGFNPIKDVYKTQVYALARFRNHFRPEGCLGPEGRVIPERIITRAPSAELRPGQTDQDALPPYEELDRILRELIEHDQSIAALATSDIPYAHLLKTRNLVYNAEYKRRQAPPGVKITARNFGRDRRYPITNGYRDMS